MKVVQSVGSLVNITNRQHDITQNTGIFVITYVKTDSMDYKKLLFLRF